MDQKIYGLRTELKGLPTWFKDLLLRFSNWDSVVLVYWETCESLEHLIVPCKTDWFSVMVQRWFNREGIVFLLTVLEQLDINMWKIETNPPSIPHIIYKNYLKMDYMPKCKTWNYKTSRRKYRRKCSWPSVKQRFFKYNIKVSQSIEKSHKLDFNKIMKWCY